MSPQYIPRSIYSLSFFKQSCINPIQAFAVTELGGEETYINHGEKGDRGTESNVGWWYTADILGESQSSDEDS